MPLVYMHLIDGTDVTFDPDGFEMPVEDIAAKALLQARDCMAGDVKDGRLYLGYRIEVQDEAGEVVHRLNFSDAVEIVQSG